MFCAIYQKLMGPFYYAYKDILKRLTITRVFNVHVF